MKYVKDIKLKAKISHRYMPSQYGKETKQKKRKCEWHIAASDDDNNQFNHLLSNQKKNNICIYSLCSIYT